MSEKQGPIERLRTPDEGEWVLREHASGDDADARVPFERDRDRILYSESFRRLQHKTQVFIVTESDRFSTRILHSMETAQIGRALAAMLGLNQCLAEAICLGHDVGHTPFGHIGEEALKECLGEWDSNGHSLMVLSELETQYPDFLGLDLTWATREGIARHKTVFDVPLAEHGDESDFGRYPAPSPEAQIANIADEIAYLSHDVHDALAYRIIQPEDLDELGLHIWQREWKKTKGEFDRSHPEGWVGVNPDSLKFRRVHRHLIGCLVRDAAERSVELAATVADLTSARQLHEPVISFSSPTREELRRLVSFMMSRVYKSPLVARQNAKAKRMLSMLFETLAGDTRLLPYYVQERITRGGGGTEVTKQQVAYFLASLTDRAAIDLWRELFAPDDRAMGHHVE